MRGFRKQLYPLLCYVTVLSLLFFESSCQLHFVSLGNFGSASSGQKATASVLKAKAKEHAVSFLISPGSNFIGGVKDLNDTKWSTSFEKPYEGPSMNLPFFTVLGNEDWKGNHTALALRTNETYNIGREDIPEEQLPFPRWTLPNWWYHYSAHFADASHANAAYSSSDGSVGFVFVDTHILGNKFKLQNVTKLHWDNLRDTIGTAVRIFDWVIVVGNKAMVSSGSSKGDAHLSETLRPFLKDMKVDAYISGNDYDMEVIEDGPLLHINCGAASSAKSAGRKTDNSVVYVGKPGFCHHMLTKKHFVTQFIDGYTGDVAGNYTKTRNVRDRSLLDRFHLYKGLPEVVYIPISKAGGHGGRPGGGAGPDRGPGSGGEPPNEGDLFVRIVGTLGLIILGGLTGLAAIVGGHRISSGSK